jgi:mannose-6-phosphate isomerase
VIAEIQQASNTTFRLFDWNRVDKDGKPRPLHIAESLAVSDYARGPVAAQQPEAEGDGWERLVTCDKFLFSRALAKARDKHSLPPSQSFLILSLVEGAGRLTGEGFDEPLAPGQTLLVPAACPATTFVAAAPSTLLDMRLPA